MSDKSPSPKPRRANIRDVAREAGVSIGTVSNALNRLDSIHPDTLSRVRKAIAHLGFQPLPGARSRRRKAPPTARMLDGEAIGILLVGPRGLPWIMQEAPVYAYAIHGVEQEATRQGRPCHVLHAKDSDALRAICQEAPPGGMVALGAAPQIVLPGDLSVPPIVRIMGLPDTRWGDCCTYSSYGAGRCAAEYLYSLNCQRFACFTNEQRGVAAVRAQGFDDTLADFGYPLPKRPSRDLFAGSHLPDEPAILAELKAMLKKSKPVDGLFVTADILAPPVYRSLEKLGIRPGADIHIISCNNERPYLADLNPPPAVIDIHAEMVGAEAVKLLARRRTNPDEPRRTLMIEPTLILPASA